MSSKSTAGVALFFCFNLLFFTLCSASHHHYKGCPPPPNPTPTPTPVPPTPVVPTPVPPTPTPESGKCPRDALKLGVCANVLSGLLNVTLGTPPVKPCCSILHGLIDLEAAVCLCTALKANILGINLNIPISLSLLLNVCSKNVPKGFLCP